MFDLEKYWWECPECDSIFRYQEEAHRCAQMDTWPEDCLEWMHRGLVQLPVINASQSLGSPFEQTEGNLLEPHLRAKAVIFDAKPEEKP